MSLHRLLGFTAALADPAAQAAFYHELGLRGDAADGFTGSSGGAGVRLEEGPFRQLRQVDIGASEESDLAAITARLSDLGLSPTHRDGQLAVLDPASQIRFTVQVADPEPEVERVELITPNAPGATVRWNERAPAVLAGPRPPRRLGHLVIGTPSLSATRDLLVDGFGCKVTDEVEGVIHFLRCSTEHHNIGLVESPVPILQHYSWECDDIDHVGQTATSLYRADTERHSWGLGRHFAGSNFYWYLRDPSGSFIELYSDLDRIDDDEAWETRGRTPFDLEHVANSWGPNLPLEFIVPDDLDHLQAGWAAR